MNFFIKLIFFILITAFSFSVAAQSKELSKEEIDKKMQQMADNINHQLPRKVDDIITLTRVNYSDKIFSYYYKIDDLSQLKNIENIKTNMTRITCSTLHDMVTEHGYSYHYNYVAPNNEQILDFTVIKDSCID